MAYNYATNLVSDGLVGRQLGCFVQEENGGWR